MAGLRCNDCGRFAKASELVEREPHLGGLRHRSGYGCDPAIEMPQALIEKTMHFAAILSPSDPGYYTARLPDGNEVTDQIGQVLHRAAAAVGGVVYIYEPHAGGVVFPGVEIPLTSWQFRDELGRAEIVAIGVRTLARLFIESDTGRQYLKSDRTDLRDYWQSFIRRNVYVGGLGANIEYRQSFTLHAAIVEHIESMERGQK